MPDGIRTVVCDEALVLARAVLDWGEVHQYDTEGPYGEYNVYDEPPKFVVSAKALLGHYEQST